jgi:hypothetical protein
MVPSKQRSLVAALNELAASPLQPMARANHTGRRTSVNAKGHFLAIFLLSCPPDFVKPV